MDGYEPEFRLVQRPLTIPVREPLTPLSTYSADTRGNLSADHGATRRPHRCTLRFRRCPEFFGRASPYRMNVVQGVSTRARAVVVVLWPSDCRMMPPGRGVWGWFLPPLGLPNRTPTGVITRPRLPSLAKPPGGCGVTLGIPALVLLGRLRRYVYATPAGQQPHGRAEADKRVLGHILGRCVTSWRESRTVRNQAPCVSR